MFRKILCVLLPAGFLIQTLHSDLDEMEKIVELDEIVVYGHQYGMLGEALSASEGIIGQGEIDQRPVLRSGEILEFVPGMVVTQHSGSGKANQYFLRGFNLDHGTDFLTTIDGMPVNMRSHGHGQGYMDLSFIVPEFVEHIHYNKGPYHVENGDFSTAGAAHFRLFSRFRESFTEVEIGEDNYLRNVTGLNMGTGDGNLLLGWELQGYDGPWSDIDEDVEKVNGMLRYIMPVNGGALALTFLGYDNSWNSADQIPERAVEQGMIDLLGSLDTTVGGSSSRYSISTAWQTDDFLVNAYVIDYEMDLYSNFTYFLDDPVNGDQFQQVDDRVIYGGGMRKQFSGELGDKPVHQQVGLDFRMDDIKEVGLHRTVERERIGTVRSDTVEEYSIGIYYEGEVNLSDRVTANFGARYDYFDVDVDSDLPANSGQADDDLLSLTAGLSYRFSDRLEGYFNSGQSFHSNDARGATIEIDPASGDPAEPVDLLVRGEGAEVGLRFADSEKLNVSFALWILELDSELLFVGDAGNTEASGASRRYGAEFAAYYWFEDSFSVDLELAWTHSRFVDVPEGEGDHIDGSVPFVASAGFTWVPAENFFTSLRARYFGERTLDNFDTVQSDPFFVVNLGMNYKYESWQFGLDILNLFDSDDHDIDYYYESRLPGEPAGGIADIHFHPIEPRTLRLHARYTF